MNTINTIGPRFYSDLLRDHEKMHSEPDNEGGYRLFFNGDSEGYRLAFGLRDYVVAAVNGPWLAMVRRPSVWTCSFAYPGTYGHECGRPAEQVAVFKSERTMDGLFFAGRCDECAAERGGENSGLIRFEPIGQQRNEWR